MRNSELGRRLSVDPLADKYFGWSPYNYVKCNPLIKIDPNGMDDYYYDEEGNETVEERSWLHNLLFGDSYYLKGSENAAHSYNGNNYWEIEEKALDLVKSGNFLLFENGEQLVDFFVANNKTSGIFPINFGEVLEKSPGGKAWDSKQYIPDNGIYIYNGVGYKDDFIGNLVWGNIMANSLWPDSISTAGAGIIHNLDNGFSFQRLLENPIGFGDDPRDTRAILMGYIRSFGAYK